MIRILLLSLSMLLPVYAGEEPRNEAELEATVVSLFKNYQYPYMSEYFKQYASKIKSDRAFQHMLVLVLYVPDKEIKRKMFAVLSELAPKHPKARDDFYLEHGKFFYLEKDWKEAIKQFEASKHPMGFYYSAWSYHYLRDDDNAWSSLTKAEESLKDKKWLYYRSRLDELQVRIFFDQKKYGEALKQAKKMGEGPQKYILLSMIYERQPLQKAKSKEMKEILLSRYNMVEEVKSYLKNN